MARNCKIINFSGVVECKKRRIGCIQLGFYQIGTEDIKYNRFIWNNHRDVIFQGKASIGSGCKISNSGELIFGDGFNMSANSTIIVTKK